MLKKAYRDLIKSVCDDDIVIFCESEGPSSALTKGESGAFEPSWSGNGPRILVTSKTRANFQPKLGKTGIQKFDQFADGVVSDADSDLTSAIYTLAHEYGHFASFEVGTRDAEYEVALNVFNDGRAKDLTATQKDLIIKEEEIAWANSKAILDGLYQVDETSFNVRRDHDLQVYREILSVI